jgi:hypothetical protein
MAKVFSSTRIVAAEIVAEEGIEMDRHAEKVMKAVRLEAMSHRLTGAYMAGLSIKTVGRRKDRIVVAEGEGAVPIEFGYTTKSGSRVQGQFILRNAYNSLKRIV